MQIKSKWDKIIYKDTPIQLTNQTPIQLTNQSRSKPCSPPPSPPSLSSDTLSSTNSMAEEYGAESKCESGIESKHRNESSNNSRNGSRNVCGVQPRKSWNWQQVERSVVAIVTNAWNLLPSVLNREVYLF